MTTKYFMNGGVNSNWSTDTNWSTTSSAGPNNTTHAITGDAAILNSGSPSCVLSSNTDCLSLDCTGYINTLTFTNQMTVSGNVTFSSGMTIAGTAKLIIKSSGTLTSAGKTYTGGLQIEGTNQTYTLADNWNISGAITSNWTSNATLAGSFTLTAASASLSGNALVLTGGDVQINGLTTLTNTLVVNGSGKTWHTWGLSQGTRQFAGTATLEFNGTGTWSATTGITSSPVSINCPGNTLTISGLITIDGSGSLNYTAGTVTPSSPSLSITGSTTISMPSGFTWVNVTVPNGGTVTNNSLMLVSGTLTHPNANLTWQGSAGWTVGTLTNVAPTASRNTWFADGVTYTVTTAYTVVPPTATTNRLIWNSVSGSYTYFNVQYGATQSVAFTDSTKINSLGGQPIFDYAGVIVDSPNWNNAIGPFVSSNRGNAVGYAS